MDGDWCSVGDPPCLNPKSSKDPIYGKLLTKFNNENHCGHKHWHLPTATGVSKTGHDSPLNEAGGDWGSLAQYAVDNGYNHNALEPQGDFSYWLETAGSAPTAGHFVNMLNHHAYFAKEVMNGGRGWNGQERWLVDFVYTNSGFEAAVGCVAIPDDDCKLGILLVTDE